MNVLQINFSDVSGGAGIAGYRLHQGLLAQGVNSKLLVGSAKTQDSLVATIPPKGIKVGLYKLFWRLGLNYLNILDSFDIPDHPFYQDADILNFHILHSGYFNYLALPRLTRAKPAIFTLHDMWGFTGHCTYSYDCQRWMTGCGQCPYPKTYPAIYLDNTWLEWRLKDWAYTRSDLTIVTLSNWLHKQAQSSLLNRFPIHHIPNGIDLEIYRPLDSETCRQSLNIPPDKKVLMVAAQYLNDYRKGGDLLIKILASLPPSVKADSILLAIGDRGEALAEASGFSMVNLGYVSDESRKAIAYSAADMFIFPTRADNLPLVLQESMACGTPMVSFNVGGVPDLVRPGITGFLAEPENVPEFCSAIEELLDNDSLRADMARNCRAVAEAEYSLDLQAQRYIELYREKLATGS